jgi:hypothetical protein
MKFEKKRIKSNFLMFDKILFIVVLLVGANADTRFSELTSEGEYGKSIAGMLELHLDQNP